MGAEAPQWLVGAFVDALSEIGICADRATREAEAYDLLARWNAPGRTAHNCRHLVHVLTLLDELSSSAHDADILRVAAWYHGACLSRAASAGDTIIDPAMTTPVCADLTRQHLTALGATDEVTERIVELLGFMSSHHAPADDSDAQVLVDADLGRLALSPQEFTKYRENLRLEFSAVDDLSYYRARRQGVRRLLDQDSIFFTDQGSAWEDAARSNLELELARIEEKLRRLKADEASSAAASQGDETFASSVRSQGIEAPVAPEHDEDLISDTCVHASPVKVIKRRSVKVRPAEEAEALVTTGVLPVISDLVDDSPLPEEPVVEADSDLSSLESAVDALGLV